MIHAKIAGLPIAIDNRELSPARFRRYLTEEAPLFTVGVTEQELEKEAAFEPHPREYLEFICAFRSIAERIGRYDAFVFHGAVIVVDDLAYIITAPSGTGKTTHIRLWQQLFGDKAWVLNGDKPIVRKLDGRFCACGTPWQGKENYGCPEIRPIAGFALLHRASRNSICPVSGDELVRFAMQQIYLPKDVEMRLKTLDLMDECFSSIPTWSLGCNMELEAARVAYEGMALKNNA